MRYHRISLILSLFILMAGQAWATNTYATQRLQQIASQLYWIPFDTLHYGTHEFHEGATTLVVRVNEWQEIEHIGLKIFYQQQLDNDHLCIYDFVERYLIELQMFGNEYAAWERMNSDNVLIEFGNLSDFFALRQTDEFRLSSLGFKGYRFSWSREGRPLLSILFPMDYQLISGCNAIELEYNYMRNIERYAETLIEIQDTLAPKSIHETNNTIENTVWGARSKEKISFLIYTFPISYQFISGLKDIELKQYNMRAANQTAAPLLGCYSEFDSIVGDYYIIEGGTYLSESIRHDLYYEKCMEGWAPLCNTRKPYWSAYNIALSSSPVGDFCLDGLLDLYGYETEPFSLPFHKWVSYCEKEGGKLYFGIRSVDSTCISGTIFIPFENKGYCHLLKVDIPLSALENRTGDIRSRLFVYIPLHNIDDGYFN